MTVRSRLLASFGATIGVLLAPSLFAVSRLAELRDFAVEGRAQHATAVLTLGRMQARLVELDRFERSYVATGEPALGASATRSSEALGAEYARLAASPYQGPAAILEPLIVGLGTTKADVDRLMDEGRVLEATEAFKRLEPLFAEGERRFGAVGDSIGLLAQRDFLEAETIGNSARRDALMGLATALILALVVATWASASLTGPLHGLGRAMARVADGRFDAPDDLPLERQDEIGDLSASFRIMARRLSDLDRMKSEFLGVASHELKTPINVIHGYAELIDEELEGEDNEGQRAIVRGISEQAQAMSKLVSRLMDISKLETGAYRIDPEQVHVSDLATGLLRSFELLAKQKGIRLSLRITPDAPRSVALDADIVRDEVLGNLVANALRHTPTGGRVDVIVDGGPDSIVFRVCDTGPGIPEKERDFVFLKHYRGNEADVGRSGLGLAIAKEMVELHGGFIGLEATPEGSGASFRVALPLAAPLGTAAFG